MLLDQLDLTTVILAVTIAIFFYFLLTSCSNRKYTNLPPGPPGLPIFGHLLTFMKCKTLFVDLAELSREYGKVVSVKFGIHDVFVLNGYDVIKETMIEKSDCFSERPNWLNTIRDLGRDRTGIFFHAGWRDRRRLTLVSMRDFGLGKKSLEDRMVEEASFLNEELAKAEGQPIDPTTILPFTTSNIICSVINGNRYQYGDPEFKRLLDYINAIGRGSTIVNFRNFVPLFGFIKTKGDKVALSSFQSLLEMCRVWMRAHAETYDPDNVRDLLDLFLAENKKNQSKLNDCDLAMLIMELFFAGTETTSTTLAWSLLYLIHNPHFQIRCREEIRQEIGMDRPPVYSDLKKTPFINAVLNESQRIGNIVPLSVLHCAAEDATLNGYTIPKGSIIMMNMLTALRDPKHWTDPDKFNPERWLDGEGKVLKNPAFIPFSTGKRICLGEQLAKKELYIFLTSMLQKFHFSMVDENNPPSLDGVGNTIHGPGNFVLKAEKV